MSQPTLTPTCWLDPGEHGAPFLVVVRFSGRRLRETGKPEPDESFTREEAVNGIVPGSGPVAVTAEIRDVTRGRWIVTARLVPRPASRVVPLVDGKGSHAEQQNMWLRLAGVPDGPTRSRPRLFAKVPGINPFAYPGLLAAGVLAALALQALLLAASGLPWTPALEHSSYAVLAGVAGAQVWHVLSLRRRAPVGWSALGFAAGALAAAATAPAAGLGIVAGAYYSTAAASLLIGLAIGWPGCFWSGRLAGKPTAARLGIWSSDRRIGCRRVPVQFMEALLALATGSAAAAAELAAGPAEAGPVAVAAPAAYALGRQFIIRLRADPPRRSALSGTLTTVLPATALLADVLLLAN